MSANAYELSDIRVDNKGKTFNSAGEHVRYLDSIVDMLLKMKQPTFDEEEHTTAKAYDPFTFVHSGVVTYVSVKSVPSGISLDNPAYWSRWDISDTSGIPAVIEALDEKTVDKTDITEHLTEEEFNAGVIKPLDARHERDDYEGGLGQRISDIVTLQLFSFDITTDYFGSYHVDSDCHCCYKRGKIATYEVIGTLPEIWSAGSTYNLGTLPDGYRPVRTYSKDILVGGKAVAITINTNGVILVIPYVEVVSATNVKISETFILL